MGNVTSVITALKTAGIRAEAAFPGRRMPQINQPVAAVMLESVDYTNSITVIRATVYSPRTQGGSACETAAGIVGKTLGAMTVSGMDTLCKQGNCEFDSSADCFCIPLTVSFSPAPETEPESEPQYTVLQGSTALAHAVAFSAWREEDADNAVALEDAVWQIRLEEIFLPGEAEETDAENGFSLTVTADTSTEVFANCSWTGVERKNTLTSLRQIRTGTAESRSYTAN